MQLPKFVLADNSDFPDDIFIIHLDFPRFIINLKDDEVEFLEDLEGEDETELESEMEHLITLAGEFYDKEMEGYEEIIFYLKYFSNKLTAAAKGDISSFCTAFLFCFKQFYNFRMIIKIGFQLFVNRFHHPKLILILSFFFKIMI